MASIASFAHLTGTGLGQPGKSKVSFLILGFAGLVPKGRQRIVVEHDGYRFTASLWRVAKAEIDVLREPTRVVAFAGDEG